MSVVLDASLTVSWFLDDESSTDAILDLVAESGANVPSLWHLEVANALQLAVRRKRIDLAYRDAALDRLNKFAIIVDPMTTHRAWSETLWLSDRFGLTVYDSAYLELARRLVLPLATLDKALTDAARASGVKVLTEKQL